MKARGRASGTATLERMSPVTGRRRLPSILAPLALLAGTAGLAGCGGSSSSGTAVRGSAAGTQAQVAQVTKAAYTTSAAPGYKIALTTTASFSGHGFTLTGGGRFTRPGPVGNLQMSVAGTELEEVVDLPYVYVRIQGRPVQGKPWARANIQNTIQALGGTGSLTSNANPSETLQYLKASGSVTPMGTEAVRGVQTTHYRVVADLNRYASMAPAGQQRQAAEQRAKLLERLTGSSTLPLEAWIDGQGHVRRVALQFPICSPAGKVGTSISLEFFDFGPQTPVSVPAAGEVADVSPQVSSKAAQAVENLHC